MLRSYCGKQARDRKSGLPRKKGMSSESWAVDGNLPPTGNSACGPGFGNGFGNMA
jgi:hypothetical protein